MGELDPEWLQRELLLINKKLTEQYPDIAPKTIEDIVEHAAADLVATTRIFTYLPIFIQRRAQELLQTIPTPDS